MEVFAGFLAHTDHHIGRLVDAVRSLPDGENTLIVFVAGDIGPSAEGSLTGTTQTTWYARTASGMMSLRTEGHRRDRRAEARKTYPSVGLGRLVETFQWMKRVPSHLGGTRNGLIVSWPAKITYKAGCDHSSTM